MCLDNNGLRTQHTFLGRLSEHFCNSATEPMEVESLWIDMHPVFWDRTLKCAHFHLRTNVSHYTPVIGSESSSISCLAFSGHASFQNRDPKHGVCACAVGCPSTQNFLQHGTSHDPTDSSPQSMASMQTLKPKSLNFPLSRYDKGIQVVSFFLMGSGRAIPTNPTSAYSASSVFLELTKLKGGLAAQ